MLTAQMKLGMAGKVNAQQAAEMMRKLQITTDGNKVSFRVEASREEVERKIQEMRKSPSFGPTGKNPRQRRPRQERSRSTAWRAESARFPPSRPSNPTRRR